MILEGSGLEGKQVEVAALFPVMEQLGFHHWTWDYKRATFDYKYEDKIGGHTFYLRVPCVAIQGDIEDIPNDTIVQIAEPYLAKHIYPHGFDYEFEFPARILESAQNKLKSINDRLEG